jgi:hypothetical protein
MGRIRPVTEEAIGREDRPDIAIELNRLGMGFRTAGGHRPNANSNTLQQ